MTREELCQRFIDNLNNQDYQEYYKFFTKETTYFNITSKEEFSYEDMLNFLKGYITNKLEIKRVLTSKVCIKYECDKINFFFDVKSRRIKRLEIEVL